jgi:hypothetical protein
MIEIALIARSHAQAICTNKLAHAGLFGLDKIVRELSFFPNFKPAFTYYDSLVQAGLCKPVCANGLSV